MAIEQFNLTLVATELKIDEHSNTVHPWLPAKLSDNTHAFVEFRRKGLLCNYLVTTPCKQL